MFIVKSERHIPSWAHSLPVVSGVSWCYPRWHCRWRQPDAPGKNQPGEELGHGLPIFWQVLPKNQHHFPRIIGWNSWEKNMINLINHKKTMINRPYMPKNIFLHRSFKIVQETMIRLKIPMVTSAHAVAFPTWTAWNQSYNVYPTSSILDEIHQKPEALFSRKTESFSRFWAGRLSLSKAMVPLQPRPIPTCHEQEEKHVGHPQRDRGIDQLVGLSDEKTMVDRP